MELTDFMPKTKIEELEDIINKQEVKIKKLEENKAVVLSEDDWFLKYGSADNILDLVDRLKSDGYIKD